MVDTTKPENVALICCKKCKISKTQDLFPKNRPTCKQCYNEIRNKKKKENPEIRKKYNEVRRKKYNEDLEYQKTFNDKRKKKYKEDEEYRKKLISIAVQDKQKKALVRRQIKEKEQEQIGLDNKKCRYCKEIKPKDRFRHNRLKCKDCEREEPLEKLKRLIRSRIHAYLKCKNKTKDKKTIEYLGCDIEQYMNYLLSYDNSCTLENKGTEWHIDHVIPLSKFELNEEDELNLAFNWRNTMPFPKYENLAKNNKIIEQQIVRHSEKLKEYHQKNNIEMPQIFIDLFARYLVVPGNP